MKYIRNIVLQSLSTLVMCSSLYASPAELSSTEAQKSKFLKKMIRLIDCGPGGEICIKTAREVNMHMECFVQAFKRYYDEYCACFAQGSAQFDDALKSHLEVRIKEKMTIIDTSHCKLMLKSEQKNNKLGYAIFGTVAMVATYVLYCLADGNLESAYALGSGCALGASSWAWAMSLTGLKEILYAVGCHNIQLKVGTKHLAALREAYAYAFPNESIKCEDL